MSTSRKQMRDNLEEAAGNLMEYVSSEEHRQDLIEDMRKVYDEYKAPMDKWFFGHIYRLYRKRADEITLATKKLEDNATETDGLEIIANYFKTGAWNENSANSILMRILIEKVEKLYKYDHHPLDLDQVKRLNTLFIKQVNIRIKENLFFDMGKKSRQDEIGDLNRAKESELENEEVEIVKSYEAPPRRKIDFEKNPWLKKVANELTNIFATSETLDEVVKSYVAPPRRKIKYGASSENPDINLTGIDTKLGEVFNKKPQISDDEDVVDVRLHGEINRFEHYLPAQDTNEETVEYLQAEEDAVKEDEVFTDSDSISDEDSADYQDDVRNMGFTDEELQSLLDGADAANYQTMNTRDDHSSIDIDQLIADLNSNDSPVQTTVTHVAPSTQDLDALIEELDKALAAMGVHIDENKVADDDVSTLSAKERFAANRKKIESHFAQTLKRREEIINEMNPPVEDQAAEEASEENDDDYSDSSESSYSSSSDDDNSSDASSEGPDEMPELEEISDDESEMSEEDLPGKILMYYAVGNAEIKPQVQAEQSSKEKFAAARQKVDALLGPAMQRREQIIKETKAVNKEDGLEDNWLSRINVDDKLNETAASSLADSLKPAEEAKSAKERFQLASRNVSTLFGATLNRKAQLEKAALAEESKPTRKMF